MIRYSDETFVRRDGADYGPGENAVFAEKAEESGQASEKGENREDENEFVLVGHVVS